MLHLEVGVQRTWIEARDVRAWALGDPLLDWLELHGAARGFERDDRRPRYDRRRDFAAFLADRAFLLQEKVLEWVDARVGVVRVGARLEDPRHRARTIERDAGATFDAMSRGAPAVGRATLVDAAGGLAARPLLLLRADVVQACFPGALGGRELFGYVLVEARFSTTRLDASGAVLLHGTRKADALELQVAARVLGRAQDWQPAGAVLVGRPDARRPDAPWYGAVRLDDAEHVAAASRALGWRMRVQAEGGGWEVTPSPALDELRPNMKNDRDQPWRAAKREIARRQEDLTRVWHVGPPARARALAAGVSRTGDARLSAALLGLSGETARVVDRLLAVNRGGPALLPERGEQGAGAGQGPRRVEPEAAPEVFAHFEAVNDLADDLRAFPARGGQPLIFHIAAGRLAGGAWEARAFTADALTLRDEADVIEAWLAFLRQGGPAPPRVVTWSPAEAASFEGAFNAARRRHPDRGWPALDWHDLLHEAVLPRPVVVRGALTFQLHDVVDALVKQGLISAATPDPELEGAGAVAAVVAAAQEAALRACRLREVDVVAALEARSLACCRALAAISGLLRARGLA